MKYAFFLIIGGLFPPHRVQLVARMIKPRCVIHDFIRSVQLVARMIKPRCVIHDFVRSVQLVARMAKPRCVIHDFIRSVQLVARIIKPQCVIHDFVRSVHLDARPNHARNVISPFRSLTISCNKLHATIHLKHNKKDRTYVIKCGRLSKRF